MGRGDSHIQEECPGRAATLSAGRRERHAMRHAADGERLDERIIAPVSPYTALMAAD